MIFVVKCSLSKIDYAMTFIKQKNIFIFLSIVINKNDIFC